MATNREEQFPAPVQAPPDPPTIHPSFIQVPHPYICEQTIQASLLTLGVDTSKEQILLHGVHWIDMLRRELQLPYKTFCTAAMYYHLFRLNYTDSENNFLDAVSAALFTACKVEDTLKKSRDIACAVHNLKLPQKAHLQPDDPELETKSRNIIGLERLMLEASAFDFRSRHPQVILMTLAKCVYKLDPEVTRMAYRISLDLFRTYAPHKQSTASLALSCLELAYLLMDKPKDGIVWGNIYHDCQTNRQNILETIFDLLELYTHHRPLTDVGNQFPPERFLTVRIPLNAEAVAGNIPRHAWSIRKPKDLVKPMEHPLTAVAANGDRYKQDGGPNAAVRYMLDFYSAQTEQETVSNYFKDLEEYWSEG
ncbi:cyclin [Penicillium taxi]|uniref:cyclin n=1 Tax=Penicillium taxi TaxID=168475 RepID=UPI00254525E2|nr:cyclin [Penicillium taxi]KAJ5899797.1 cyclin [Penicillium taxi]